MDLMYCAGIIDGEGHIGIHVINKKEVIVFRIQMDDENAIKTVAKGLQVAYFKHRYNNDKDHFLIAMSHKKAYEALKKIEPYLITKKGIAQKCINKYIETCKKRQSKGISIYPV